MESSKGKFNQQNQYPLRKEKRKTPRPYWMMTYGSVDSTNSEAKRYVCSGGPTPAVLWADTQTAGRGRMGRSFFSPPKTGIYLSVVCPMSNRGSEEIALTCAVAVVARRAIREATGIAVQIKWVNDLYLGDRKVAGILCESFSFEGTRYVIIGIGVNLCTEEFPEELRDRAGSLTAESGGLRERLSERLIEALLSVGEQEPSETLLAEYREASMVLGKAVTYIENGKSYAGRAVAIDAGGRLEILRGDGTKHLLCGGEITLRLNENESETISNESEENRR